MILMDEEQRPISGLISKLVYCNQFSGKRYDLEKDLLGREFEKPRSGIRSRENLQKENNNILKLTKLTKDLANKLLPKLDKISDNQNFDEMVKEYKLLRDLAYFILYSECRDGLLGLIKKADKLDKTRISDAEFEEEINKIHKKFRDTRDSYFPTQLRDKLRALNKEYMVRRVDTLSNAGASIPFPGFNDDKREDRYWLHCFAIFFQLARGFYYIFHKLVGGSAAMENLRIKVWESIFTSDFADYINTTYGKIKKIPTLIVGETGTGKEVVARAIAMSQYIRFEYSPKRKSEDNSQNKDELKIQVAARGRSGKGQNPWQVYQAINIAAFNLQLLESELFGHVKGAFTGALKEDKIGYLEKCTNGVLLIDEIGELDPKIQVKLLRIFNDRQFNRVGDTESKTFNGKLIFATNRPLLKKMENGSFRKDFYFRINADLIETPTLRGQLRSPDRDRADELEYLVKETVERFLDDDTEEDWGRYKKTEKDKGDFYRQSRTCQVNQWKEKAFSRILNRVGVDYEWPGNYRELEQYVHRVIIHSECQSEKTNLRMETGDGILDNYQSTSNANELFQASWAKLPSLEQFSMPYVKYVYQMVARKNNGKVNLAEVARKLEMDPRTLLKRIEKYKIKYQDLGPDKSAEEKNGMSTIVTLYQMKLDIRKLFP